MLLIVTFVICAKLEQYLKPVLVYVSIAYVDSLYLEQCVSGIKHPDEHLCQFFQHLGPHVLGIELRLLSTLKTSIVHPIFRKHVVNTL